MKVNVLWGNPIAIVLVSCVFSVILIVISISTLLSGQVFDEGHIFFVAVVTFFNSATMIAFYAAYRHEIRNSKHAFMSPKRYKKSVRLGEQYESAVNRLRNSLRHTGERLEQLDDDAIIDRAVEVIESYDIKSIKD
jgi:hypothetical protein